MDEGTEYASNSLLGVIRFGDKNLSDAEASNLIQPTAFMKALKWIEASSGGTTHKMTLKTGAPSAQFRAINEGIVNTAGTELTLDMSLKFLDAGIVEDVALVTADSKGKEHYMNKRAMESLDAGFSSVEYQLIRGIGWGAAGCKGLADYISLYKGMTYDAGGAGGERVYFMVMAENAVCGVVGNEGEFADGEIYQTRVTTDVATGAGYEAYGLPINGYLGLQVAGLYSLAMGFNFDGTSTHDVTDKACGRIFNKFPSAVQPKVNGILMSRAGRLQLQESRTYTSATGTRAPLPTEWEGIPIYVSDACASDTSTITTTTSTTTTT